MLPAIALCLVLTLSGCVQRLPKPEPAAAAIADATPPTFTVQAGMNDTWNAVGQVLIRTPGVSFDGRSQMMGLNAVRFRGAPLLVLTRALPLSDVVMALTTEVSVTTPNGTPVHGNDAAELLGAVERDLPAEIERVKAGLAAQAVAARQPGTPKKKKNK
ncbi:MAG: hypothetical protein ABIO84_09995 [Lysobacter sp.]